MWCCRYELCIDYQVLLDELQVKVMKGVRGHPLPPAGLTGRKRRLIVVVRTRKPWLQRLFASIHNYKLLVKSLFTVHIHFSNFLAGSCYQAISKKKYRVFCFQNRKQITRIQANLQQCNNKDFMCSLLPRMVVTWSFAF